MLEHRQIAIILIQFYIFIGEFSRDTKTFIKNNTRFELYDWIRIIATLFVVVGHSVYLKITVANGGVDYQLPVNLSPAYYAPLLTFIRKAHWIIVYFHMPLFFFLSGAVFGIKPITKFSKLILSKIKRLIIPFFAVGIFYMIHVKYLGNFYTFNGMIESILSIWHGGQGYYDGHLWFLAALFWCFILFTILIQLLKKIHMENPFIPLIICFIIATLASKYTTTFFMEFHSGLKYIQWFAAGYIFEKYRHLYKFSYVRSAIICIIFIGFHLWNREIHFDNYYFLIIFGIIFSIALANVLSPLFKYFDANFHEGYRYFIKKLFIIYLFHDPLEYLVLRLFFNRNLLSHSFGCYAYLFMRTIGVILISLFISSILDILFLKFKPKKFNVLLH